MIQLPNYHAVEAWLATPNLSPTIKNTLQGIPVEVGAKLSVQRSATPGDPTASGSLTSYSIIGIPVWNYAVNQSFADNGSSVTYVAPADAIPSPYYPGWSLANHSNTVSSPIPYPNVQANNQAIFSYTLVDFVTVETQTANIDFTFYGTGQWYDSQFITTS